MLSFYVVGAIAVLLYGACLCCMPARVGFLGTLAWLLFTGALIALAWWLIDIEVAALATGFFGLGGLAIIFTD